MYTLLLAHTFSQVVDSRRNFARESETHPVVNLNPLLPEFFFRSFLVHKLR